MPELKCPHCGKTFVVEDTELNSIVSQIRDQEFDKDLSARVKEIEAHLSEKHQLDLQASESQLKLSLHAAHEKNWKSFGRR